MWLRALLFTYILSSSCTAQDDVVAALGDPDWARREEAHAALVASGFRVQRAVEQALGHPDPEVRSRAAEILEVFREERRNRLRRFIWAANGDQWVAHPSAARQVFEIRGGELRESSIPSDPPALFRYSPIADLSPAALAREELLDEDWMLFWPEVSARAVEEWVQGCDLAYVARRGRRPYVAMLEELLVDPATFESLLAGVESDQSAVSWAAADTLEALTLESPADGWRAWLGANRDRLRWDDALGRWVVD